MRGSDEPSSAKFPTDGKFGSGPAGPVQRERRRRQKWPTHSRHHSQGGIDPVQAEHPDSMKLLRAVVVAALLVVAAFIAYRLFSHPSAPVADTVGVYYCKLDGETLAKWSVSLNPNARDLASVAFYATTQAVAGPAQDTPAIRFPPGTVVRSVHVSGANAVVDLGGAIARPQDGSFAESGEFKALVWTLTALPGIDAVQVKIGGALVPTLPGGHFELDEPLTRKSW